MSPRSRGRGRKEASIWRLSLRLHGPAHKAINIYHRDSGYYMHTICNFLFPLFIFCIAGGERERTPPKCDVRYSNIGRGNMRRERGREGRKKERRRKMSASRCRNNTFVFLAPPGLNPLCRHCEICLPGPPPFPFFQHQTP